MSHTIQPNILVLEGLWSDTGEAIRAAGGLVTEDTPWSYLSVREELLSGGYQGLVLTGGSDISPELYHEDPHPEVYGIDELRDETEFMALDIAKSLGIPVLGICRGSQIMCAFRGGKLTQHIDGHRSSEHAVYAANDARTFRRACNGREMQVVSLHHQCVRRPGKGMRIAAYGIDGTPEAIESKDGLWLGCQFHPELNAFANSNSFHIFKWLVDAAARYAGGRAPSVRFRSVRGRQSLYKETSYGFTKGYASYSGDTTSTDLTLYDRGDGPRDEHLREIEAESVALPRPRSRQAGEPSIPSMREAVSLIEMESGRLVPPMIGELDIIDVIAQEITTCPDCGMMFDLIEDRDDHVKYVHKRKEQRTIVPFLNANERYPELEPPAGHEAWDTEADDEKYEQWLRSRVNDGTWWADRQYAD